MRIPTPQPIRQPASKSTPSALSESDRGSIAVRWSVDKGGSLRLAWPEPGQEHTVAAAGWTRADRACGVIAFATDGVDAGLLDRLDTAFPGLRWFEGAWENDDDAGVRMAA